jgi:hypothetical protein
MIFFGLQRKTNHTRRNSRTRIASGKRVFMATPPHIIGAGIDDYRSADNGMGSEQLYFTVGDAYHGDTRVIDGNVPQISHHALLVLWCAMGFA